MMNTTHPIDTNRLLILEDDINVAKLISNIAIRAGYDTHITTTPDEFWARMTDWKPAFIVIDLIMPDMDGVEVLSRLSMRNCKSRIIITSGVGSRILSAAQRSALEQGLDVAGVLPKPFATLQLKCLLYADKQADLAKNLLLESEQRPPVTFHSLAEAIEKKQLIAFFQPKIDCDSGKLAGFEVLARWTHPEEGLIYPDEFISIAEQLNLIQPLTYHVIETSFTDFTRYLDIARRTDPKLAETITISINISAKALDDQAFATNILSLCTKHNIPTRQVVLELTESSAMNDPITSLKMLTRLRMQGFQLAIDDFGIGYSSVVQLIRLPFSEIKIDKSFVMTAKTDKESLSVIKFIIDLGNDLGLQITAEGVEDEETLIILKSLGCNQAQGYFISYPMPADELLKTAEALTCTNSTLI
ncbi:EAL domain-containing protein [Methylophaga sp. OBS4]|uniref:EAL domain-containing response regulator n=1 Tax=Methylophaga sp. OBS4 TaxID=2991935 RepID=UPI00225C23BF|nr:EAL domain-containing response regulator [Methylophaga sp. OBS4]MCX4187048.1 EAL domain-containing response regulator [Methylophaga sp. OBS4]